ncbi:MAG TPA: fibronectin type III domain-containing protein [Solirubrobacteraceae bacterium]|nr:fibronectin type III domain-containing protein [Solirubrobacteraceae bacterium]
MSGFLKRLAAKLLLVASVVPVLLLGPSLLRAPVTLLHKLAVRTPTPCAGKTPRAERLTRLAGPRVRLSWKAPSGAGGGPAPLAYRVLRSGHTVGQTSRTSMVVAVTSHKRVTFTVQARYAQAPAACAATLRSALPVRLPGAVKSLRVLTIAGTQVSLSWGRSARGDAPIEGYRIVRDGKVAGQSKHASFQLKLSNGRAHHVTVAGVDTRGRVGPAGSGLLIDPKRGVLSSRRQAVSSSDGPSTPSKLTVSDVSDAGATLAWIASAQGGARIIGYRVYRDAQLVTQITATSLRLDHLSSAHTYQITVSAIDAAHHESAPTPALGLTTTHTPPQGPALMSASSVTDTSATLSWQAGAAASGTLTGYLLYQDGVPLRVVNAQTATVTLASNRHYTFSVRALDSLGYLSAGAPSVEVVTTHTPPSTPTALNATQVSDVAATVSWSPSTPVSGTIIGYRVFRDGIPVGQNSTTSMALTSLAPSTDYAVTVAAVDSLGAISPLTAPLLVHTADPTPTHGNVQAFLLASTDQSFHDLQAHYQQIGVVYPTYFDCDFDGSTIGSDDPLVSGWAQARKIKVLPRYNCQNPTTEHKILTDTPTREHTIDAIMAVVEAHNYDGIQIDFEAAPPADRNPFTAFITELAGRLHAENRLLSTIVTAKTYNIQSGRAAMYDDAALSVPSDYIFVLDWGLHWTTSAPGAMNDLPWWTQVADYTATMPNKSKFTIGMPLYGIDWPNGGGSHNPGTPLEYDGIMELAQQYSLTPIWDNTAAAPHFSYTDASGIHHDVWYTDQRDIQLRLQHIAALGMGAGLWHLGTEDQTVWNLTGLGGSG